MGDKYKIKKSDLKAFFASADMEMRGNYHKIFKSLGLVQGKYGNFECINALGHNGGKDANPSMHINNETGTWLCYTCEIKGNLQSYWRDYLKGSGEYNDSYTDFLIDHLKLDATSLMNFSTHVKDKNFEKNSRELRALYDSMQSDRLRKLGRPWLMSGELVQVIKELTTIPMKHLDQWVENLLNEKDAMDYLYRTRKITEKVIKKYRIGYFKHTMRTKSGIEKKWKYVFPTISAEGDLINIKAYDPNPSEPWKKWLHPYSGYKTGPIPMNNFTESRLIFFEGEPDTYCAISFGYDGAVTLGAKVKNDVNKSFGEDQAKQIFLNKEIIICLDADDKETGNKEPAKKLAMSLYPYAKQIKIIDLNKSDINPNGLDESLMKETVNKNGVKKMKRVEKDFTDFMKKNGFGEAAKRIFDKLIEDTLVFTYNPDRIAKETYKVALQEARQARYFSSDRSKELELTASVKDFNDSAFMYPTKFSVTCQAMCDGKDFEGKCKNCCLPDAAFDEDREKNKAVVFNFVSEIEKEHTNDPRYIVISDHDILGLIEATNKQKVQHQARLAHVNEMCKQFYMTDKENEKLLHVRLGRDINEFMDPKKLKSATEIDMDSYIIGDADIYPNKSYKFIGSQTTSWNSQEAILFAREAMPIETSIESFKMSQEVHDTLSVFKLKDGESIERHLERRYNILADHAGITGRRDLFLINDLSFFSAVEIKNKMLPEVTRGWVEVLIAGDSRTGKTVINKFLHKYYKVGEIVGGSSGVSRSGLIGGVQFYKNKAQIKWGKIPMYDLSILTIDEMGRIPEKDLSDLIETRSEGIAKINKIACGSALARTRKVFLSNPRKGKNEDEKSYSYGIQLLKDLCMDDDGFLARFDIGCVIYSGDVPVSKFKATYENKALEFTEFQCSNLIMWAYSRTADDIVFENEEEFNTEVNEAQKRFGEKFHTSTQLINQECRAKLVRLSVSLATMLYSTPEDNPLKILVKKEHLNYIENFLMELYSSPNMGLDEYSKMKFEFEVLGNMDFMTNVCKYVDVRPMVREEEFSEKGIREIFMDYLWKVKDGELAIPDAKSDKNMSTGKIFMTDVTSKFIGILTTRNCLIRSRRGMYKKTPMFKKWLEERIKLGHKAACSNILEIVDSKSNNKVLEKIESISEKRAESAKRKIG